MQSTQGDDVKGDRHHPITLHLVSSLAPCVDQRSYRVDSATIPTGVLYVPRLYGRPSETREDFEPLPTHRALSSLSQAA